MPRTKVATTPTTTPTTKRGQKRGLSANSVGVAATPEIRTSKRLKASAENTPTNGKTTPKKSKYFEEPGSEEEEDEISVDEASTSGYDDDDDKDDTAASTTGASDPGTESDDYDSEESKPKPKKRGRKPGVSNNVSRDIGDDLWREGVKTGLGPGKQVFIAKPKPRDDGGIKYAPDKIHPNTMAFLADLKKNNDREWLKRHDPDYRQSWKDWESFVETLTEKISEIDETIPELPPKDLVFRIYRDVRFSSDPTPYKPHFSAAWSRTGRKGPYACYYVQIQPGGRSLVGGGLWHPDAQPLALIRRNIDHRPEVIRDVLMQEAARKHLLRGVVKDGKKALKAFCSQNAENALKTKPKGYDADHPNIDLLRLRNFTVGKQLHDSDILGPGLLQKIIEVITAMHPFVTYLNSVVMPDHANADGEDGDSASDGDDDHEEETGEDDEGGENSNDD